MSEESPKLFISYSWSSPEHEQWVLNLAIQLGENGVDVILDKWDLKEGQDAHAFMEKMVNDPEIRKVALICDRLYAEKADERSGGVGTETQIISPEIYEKQDQVKFVAIVVERDDDDNAYLPTYYKSRIYIDLSDESNYAQNFEQLLRWIYDKPLYLKPETGTKPAFLSDEAAVSLGTTPAFRRALDAIRNRKDYYKGALNEYFQVFSANLERFRITEKEGEFDEKVIKNIEEFLPYRNEAIEIFLSIAQSLDIPETRQELHRFFEGLIQYMERPEHLTSYREWDFDNYKFIIHELFLIAVSSLLKYECFESVAYLLRHQYYVGKDDRYKRENMMPFTIFRQYMRSLKRRNERLKLRRLSLRADLLEERAKSSGLAFHILMQADFVLYVRDCLESLKIAQNWRWWPETLLYAERYRGAFEIFARAQSQEYFNNLKCILNIESKEELEPLVQAWTENKKYIPSWEFTTIVPTTLLGYERLASRP